jgi:hypothetical protein
MSEMEGCDGWKEVCAGDETVEGIDERYCTSLVDDTSHRGWVPLPASMRSRSSVISLCSSHVMEGCVFCRNDADCASPLRALAGICTEMDHGECAEYHEMCADLMDAGFESEIVDLCPRAVAAARGEELPLMRMYFHTGIADIVLFTSWIPRTGPQYFGTVVAIIIMGIASAALKALRVYLFRPVPEHLHAVLRPVRSTSPSGTRSGSVPPAVTGESGRRRQRRRHGSKHGNHGHDGVPLADASTSDSSSSPPASDCCSTDVLAVEHASSSSVETSHPRHRLTAKQAMVHIMYGPHERRWHWLQSAKLGCLSLVTVTLDYFLMLIAMTFNVGLFIAVVVGIALGHAIFGQHLFASPAELECCS